MFPRQHVGRLELEREGIERHRLVVVEEFAADGEELGA
jgi:hypothetical protein